MSARLGLIAVLAGLLSPALVSAAPAPARYVFAVRVIEDGKVVAEPRLSADAGETAAFMWSRDGSGWSLNLSATPKAGGSQVVMTSDGETWSGLTRDHVQSTLLMERGKSATLAFPSGDAGSKRFEISVTPG